MVCLTALPLSVAVRVALDVVPPEIWYLLFTSTPCKSSSVSIAKIWFDDNWAVEIKIIVAKIPDKNRFNVSTL